MALYSVQEAAGLVCKKKQTYYGSDDIDSAGLGPFLATSDSPKGDHFYYGVRIVTGSEKFAGTLDTDIYLSLVGSKAKTGRVPIVQGYFSLSGTSAQYHDDLVVETDKDLGEILVVVLGNPRNWIVAGSSWFVDFVDVFDLKSMTKLEFPCYHWIDDGDEISFTSKTAILKDVKNNTILCVQREQQLEYQRQRYKWEQFPDLGLPSGIDVNVKVLPTDEQFSAVKTFDYLTNALTAKGTLTLKSKLSTITSLADFEALACALEKPSIATYELGRWTRDEEMGRQILNGINPVIVRRCTSLPPNFPVTNEMVKESLVRSLTLEQEMQSGSVYICDYAIMDDLPCREGWYCAAPICLLYVNNKKQLVPIAIQLKQKPGVDNPIFLPTDNWADWLLAKMYFQNASTQFHQIATHYLPCHATLEVFGVGVMRNLPDAHPVYKLLKPHFRFTMAINTKGRARLMNNGGTVDKIFSIGGKGREELMRRGGKVYSIQWNNIKHNLKSRGVDDPKLLPAYYYRDDGVKLWDIIESFVGSVINEFYSNDDDVKGDSELQNFAADVHTNGFPGHHGGEVGHGFPKSIETKTRLTEICTLAIFTASAQHAAVNFGQYDVHAFSPNAAAGLRLPPPTVKGKATAQTVLDTLPDIESAALAIAVAHMLSLFSSDEQFLGTFPAERFTEKKVQEMIKQFRKALAALDEELKKRNESLDVPYIYLLPSRVPNSITI